MGKIVKPRGRCTPYAFFLNVCRDQCAKKLSREVDFKVLQKICSKEWSLMSDYHKVRFVQMSKYDELRYEKEIAEYNLHKRQHKVSKLVGRSFVPFTKEEDKILLQLLATCEGETKFKNTVLPVGKDKIMELCHNLGRGSESICGRMKRLLRDSSYSKNCRLFSLEEDKILIDSAIKELLRTKSLQETTIPNFAELAISFNRHDQSVHRRWKANIRTWLLQYYAKTLNLEIRPMLSNFIADNFESEGSINWNYVLTAVPEFSGHTNTSLRYLFASVIKNHASKKLNTPIEKLSLKQIAAFADENYKQRKLRKTIEKRQHDLIEYFESLVKLNKIDNFV